MPASWQTTQLLPACRFRDEAYPLRVKLLFTKSMQEEVYTLASLDPHVNIRYVFNYDQLAVIGNRLFNNVFACFMVDREHLGTFSAGDLFQKLFGAFAAVALQPPAKIQIFIALMAQTASSKQFTYRSGSDIVFSEIDSWNGAWRPVFTVWKIKYKIKIPCIFSVYKFSLFGVSISR